jgi:IS5 family transposase
MPQPGFFDVDDRFKKLDEKDGLLRLNALIDWELFRPALRQVRAKPRKSAAGCKPFDEVLMFKGLVLQHLYNFSDQELEFQIRDRFTFLRFLGLSPEDRIPDGNTFWDFRELLVRSQLIEELFETFGRHLAVKGFTAMKGQIVDASFVEAPRQRNTREDNALIKAGEIPPSFEENAAKRSQKDTDARWTKKDFESHYGYKNHVSVDNKHKLIRGYAVTPAQVHDSSLLLDVLAENTSRKVWADSAYSGEKIAASLKADGYQSCIHEQGYRNAPLTAKQKAYNRKKSKIRARVEHVFGSITNDQDGMHVRIIGLVRATTKVGLTNLVYNLRRFETLCRIATPAGCR